MFTKTLLFVRAPLILLGALAGVASTATCAADLSVEISGVTSNEGRVFVALYQSAAQMKASQVFIGQKIEASTRGDGSKVKVVFVNLPEGIYAVTSFHDRNNDGKLNTNLLGLPTEPYAFANNAIGSFGPPSFEAASVKMTDAPLLISINLAQD